MPNPLPLVEATSAQNFSTLTTLVATKLGVASYGPFGTGIPSLPTDVRNLNICQGIVNDAIRMFLSDAPAPAGWYFQKPVCQVDLWPAIGPDYSVTGSTGSTYVTPSTYNSTTSTVQLMLTVPQPLPSTVSTYPVLWVPNFVQSMEMQQIWLGGQPSTNTQGWFVPPNSPLASTSTSTGLPFTVYSYNGPYNISVYIGGASSFTQAMSTSRYSTSSTVPFSFASQGNYTLPANFGGEVAGEITFVAQTNRGMILHWVDETNIRIRRQNYNQEFGTPFWAAVRLQNQPDWYNVAMPYNSSTLPPYRRRWELMTWRVSNEFLSVLFPYVLAFDNLVNNTDLPPSPISFDDVLMAACRAQAERYMTDSLAGPDWSYYRNTALHNAYKINGRAANRSIGYNGRGLTAYQSMNISNWRNWDYMRPPVGILPPGAGSY